MRRIQPVFLVLVLAMWLPLALLIAPVGGCVAGTHGLMRPIDDQVYAGITNGVVRVVQVAATAAPQPFGAAAEAAGAAVLALLAAWQGISHSKIRKLAATTPDDTTKGTP